MSITHFLILIILTNLIINSLIVSRYFEGRNIVLRATRPLSPGDVVSENYGPHFMMRGLKERQRALTCRYWFKCECVACKEDWPTLKMMSGDTPPYIRLVVSINVTVTKNQTKKKLISMKPIVGIEVIRHSRLN